MSLTKFTFPGLDIYLDVLDISYMERELRPDTLLVLPNEKDYYTKIALKNGRVIAVIETPEYILDLIKKAENSYIDSLGIETSNVN